MDDDDFGGFEAAETLKDGNGEPQTTPAIPWAAFPTGRKNSQNAAVALPEIHIPQTVSSEVLLEQPAPSSCFASSDPYIPSGGDIPIDTYCSSITSTVADLQQQTSSSIGSSLDVSVSSLSLAEGLETATDDVANLELNESKKCLQHSLSSLEVKLRAADEEKCRIKKDFEDLLEKYRILETDFLKEKEDKLISHQDRYIKLQEKHKLELEDLRRAGQEALAIIVEEFKSLLQSVVEQREKAIEKQYASAVEKQAQKCEELLAAQHQRLLDMLDMESKVMEEKTEESLLQMSQKYKEMLEKCMENEREHNKETLVAATKIEKEVMQAAIITAVKEEREIMEKRHAEEKELWQADRNKDHERVAQAIENTVQEHRQIAQAMVETAILEEQKKSEKAVEEAVKQAREELMEYVREQKRLDQIIRQRSLSSLELFLSCAQKQLTSLLHEEPTTIEGEQEKLPL